MLSVPPHPNLRVCPASPTLAVDYTGCDKWEEHFDVPKKKICSTTKFRAGTIFLFPPALIAQLLSGGAGTDC